MTEPLCAELSVTAAVSCTAASLSAEPEAGATWLSEGAAVSIGINDAALFIHSATLRVVWARGLETDLLAKQRQFLPPGYTRAFIFCHAHMMRQVRRVGKISLNEPQHNQLFWSGRSATCASNRLWRSATAIELSFQIGSLVHSDKQLSGKQHNEHLSSSLITVRTSLSCVSKLQNTSCAIVLLPSRFPLRLLLYAGTLSRSAGASLSAWNHPVPLRSVFISDDSRPFNSCWKKHFLLFSSVTDCFHLDRTSNGKRSEKNQTKRPLALIFYFPQKISPSRRREGDSFLPHRHSSLVAPYARYWFTLHSLAEQIRCWQLTRFDFPCALPHCCPRCLQTNINSEPQTSQPNQRKCAAMAFMQFTLRKHIVKKLLKFWTTRLIKKKKSCTHKFCQLNQPINSKNMLPCRKQNEFGKEQCDSPHLYLHMTHTGQKIMHVWTQRGGEHSNISAVAADSAEATSPYKIGLFIAARREYRCPQPADSSSASAPPPIKILFDVKYVW